MNPEERGIDGRLRAARERLGWSREELAVRAGLSWSAVAQVESGRRRNLRPRTVARLAEALGISCDYLISGGPTPPMLDHQALLYEGEEDFAECAGRFLLDGVERSEATLAVTSRQNIGLLEKELGGDAKHVELVDSAKVLTDPETAILFFTRYLTERLRQGAPWVRVIGEPIWKGRSADQVRLWTKHESLINLQFAGSPASVLCPYDLTSVDRSVVEDAHLTHPRMMVHNETRRSDRYVEPGPFVLGP